MPRLMYRPSGALPDGVLEPAHSSAIVCPRVAVGKRMSPLRGFYIGRYEQLRDAVAHSDPVMDWSMTAQAPGSEFVRRCSNSRPASFHAGEPTAGL